jgi:hypothetical protein
MEQLASYKGKIRLYGDIHNTSESYPENKESPEFYQKLYNVGINYQLVNKGIMHCQFIKDNFEPTPH